MAKRKNPYGKYSAKEYRENLERLAAYYGSQKKAADKLGISPSTYRNHMRGQATPSPKVVAKTNRIYGANRNKINTPEVEERRRKQEERSKRAIDRARDRVKAEATSGWIDRMFPRLRRDERNGIVAISPYVAYQSNDSAVQFWDGFEPQGRPRKKFAVDVWAMYSGFSSLQGEIVIDESIPKQVIKTTQHIGENLNRDISIDEAIQSINKTMRDTVQLQGKRKLLMSQVIGYRLR